ncbi:MAG: GNAT family N-acetyltransferase [Pseudomonadales bacterium]
MQVHVVKVTWQEQQAALQAIRTQVFVVEQEVDPAEEWDDQDPIAAHFLALNEAGQALGCARLVASGQIGRMAVLEEHRGRGLGERLLAAAVADARAQKMDRVFLHAQAYVEAFYRKAGFVVCGPEFEEVGIRHLPMEMRLPLEFEAPEVDTRPAVRPHPQSMEDEEAEPLDTPAERFSSLEGARDALITLLNQARRQVYLLSPLLDHDLLDQEPVVEAFSSFARRAPRAEIRILLMSSKIAVDRGHRLVELARRLDQKIQIRWHDEEVTESTSSFACADLSHYWLLPVFEQYVGVYHADQVLTKRFRQTFVSAWDKSKEDPELRLLRL